MLKRSMFKFAAAAAVLLATSSAMAGGYSHSKECVVDFRGSTKEKKSLTFSANGLSVVATGGAYNGNTYYTSGTKVGRYAQGLGVINGSNDNSHTVDGRGHKDVLTLTFSKLVKLTQIKFGWTKGGKVEVLAEDHSSLGTYNLQSIGFGYYKVDLAGLVGTTFGFKAPGKYDSWKVASVTACEVPPPSTVIPTPAAGLAGLSLLGLVLASRRRLGA